MSITTHHIATTALCSISLLTLAAILTPQVGVIGSTYAVEKSTPVNLTVNPVIEIDAPGSLPLDPVVPGLGLKTNKGQVVVSTNNSTGYNLTLSMAGGYTAGTGLNHTVNPSIPPIASVSGNVAASSFPNDRWGYSCSRQPRTGQEPEPTPICPESSTANFNIFRALPGFESDQEHSPITVNLNGSKTPIDSDPTEFAVGAKVTTNTASGTYSNFIQFTAVANYAPPVLCNPSATNINNAICLQDINASVKSSMNLGQQYILRDARDAKPYRVAKLKMNSAGTETAVWMTQNLALELKHDEPLKKETTDLNSGIDEWNPLTTTYNGSTGTGTAWQDSNTAPYSIVNPTPEGTDPPAPDNAGVYYNWTAAVARDNTSGISSGTMQDSICPKGWQLPIGGSASATDNQFTKLFTAYGWNSSTGQMPAADPLTTPPINFVLAGYVYSGTVRCSGDFGGLRSPVVYSSSYAYYGRFNSGVDANPGSNSTRDSGFSVRCVAR